MAAQHPSKQASQPTKQSSAQPKQAPPLEPTEPEYGFSESEMLPPEPWPVMRKVKVGLLVVFCILVVIAGVVGATK